MIQDPQVHFEQEENAAFGSITNYTTKRYAILLTLTKSILNSVFDFFNAKRFTEIFETKNKSIRNMLTNYLKAYTDVTSPVLECYPSDDKYSFLNLLVKARLNFSKQPITYRIVINSQKFQIFDNLSPSL